MAEFTVAAVGGSEPVLQAGPVHHGQAPRALAGGQQLPRGPAFMADPAEQLVAGQTGTQETTVKWEDSSVGEGNTYLTGVVIVGLCECFSVIFMSLTTNGNTQILQIHKTTLSGGHIRNILSPLK